jgi:hypothetical protein
VRLLAFTLWAASGAAFGGGSTAVHDQSCGQNEVWDSSMSMCMPSVGAASSQGAIVSARFNAFGVFNAASGPRGGAQFAAPNMFMIDAGTGIGARQFLNLDLMGTAERWTYPDHGYTEPLQIGEVQANGTPYVDAQHPHSSPIMGLTLEETIKLGSSSRLAVFFAPRGESTDGPIAYMHRESARDDPDAPLGHHVGQDVGHISSTVLGARLDLGAWRLEASAFNGTEPEPTRVDLPIAPINSAALRISYHLTPSDSVMASAAKVDQSDALYPGTRSATRLSGSLYDHLTFEGADIDQSFVFGSISRHPNSRSSVSFLDEVLWQLDASDFWGRVEVLQRLRSELRIPASARGDTQVDDERWVSALTFGVTHWALRYRHLEMGMGAAITMDVVPAEWSSAYGSRTPVTGRLLLQIRGSHRWQR